MDAVSGLIRKDLEKLVILGNEILAYLLLEYKERGGTLPEKLDRIDKSKLRNFDDNYQRWYTESYAVIQQLLPSRLSEFEEAYSGDRKRKKVDGITYCIQDWLRGVRAASDVLGRKEFDDLASVFMRFINQVRILESSQLRFESSLLEIRQLLQSDLFDSEIEASTELLKNGYLRAAGVLSGVVIESHLLQVCKNHAVIIRKRDPTISEINDLLKRAGVIDVPTWRFIQRIADLRNLCGHKKEREPIKTEVEELIANVEKILKTIS
jgi:hypothetical protein